MGQDVVESALAYAMYAPLHRLDGCERLMEPLEEAFAEGPSVVAKILREPLEERSLARDIPALTPIAGGLSGEVRAQYEENPFPRWLASPDLRPMAFGDFLKTQAPALDAGHLAGRPLKLLVAGCGTGQEPITHSLRFSDVDITALDLSRTSIAYAMRMAKALGISNIRFAQADILELGALDERFDIITSRGVLHHLEEPEEGLRRLLGLLAPRGVLRLGLYSERGRQRVVAARDHIAAKGYPASPEGIREFREEIIAAGPAHPLHGFTDQHGFYTTSDLRDLVFNVLEHRYTPLGIASLVKRHGLDFGGFLVASYPGALFRRDNPDPASWLDLEAWDAFETRHPETVAGLYEFWCQR